MRGRCHMWGEPNTLWLLPNTSHDANAAHAMLSKILCDDVFSAEYPLPDSGGKLLSYDAVRSQYWALKDDCDSTIGHPYKYTFISFRFKVCLLMMIINSWYSN